MAVTYDNSALATLTSGSPSTSFTTTGSNLGLVVCAYNVLGDGTDPSAITYAGVALTKLGTHTIAGITTGSLWYLGGASSGPNTLALTTAGDAYFCTISSYAGVLGTAENFNYAVSTTHTCNVSITSGASDMIVASTKSDASETSWSGNSLTIASSNSTNGIAVGYLQAATTTVGFTANGGGTANMLTLGVSLEANGPTVKTQLGQANIRGTTTQTQLGKASLNLLAVKTQLGKSSILGATNQTQLGKSNITVTTTKTQLGISYIIPYNTPWTPENKHSSIWNPETKHV